MPLPPPCRHLMVHLGEGARYGTFAITPTDDSAPDGTQVTRHLGHCRRLHGRHVPALDVTDDDATILFVDEWRRWLCGRCGLQTPQRGRAPISNDNHYMRGGTGEASWTFTGLEEGQYFVSATWNHVSTRTATTLSGHPSAFRNGSGNLLSTLTVDQTQTPADFTDGGYGWEAFGPGLHQRRHTDCHPRRIFRPIIMRWPMRSGSN